MNYLHLGRNLTLVHHANSSTTYSCANVPMQLMVFRNDVGYTPARAQFGAGLGFQVLY